MNAYHREAEQLVQETGMGYVQAYRHLKQRDELRRLRCLRRRQTDPFRVTGE